MLLENFIILCVEDDPTTRILLQDLLESKVKKLYIANDGVEGLKLYTELKPDIVLTDILMPNMDGIEMSKRIKDIDKNQHIVVFTALNEASNLHQAINLGIDKYLIKPITNLEIFYKTLESVAKTLQDNIDKENMEYILQTQNKLTAISDIMENIAHQWRQPLGIINSKTSNLKVNIELGNKITNETINSCIDTVMHQTQYLSDTIYEFKTFFSDKNNSKKRFDVKEIIKKVIDITEEGYKEINIEIISNTQSCTIYQNETQLLQALLNIFNNVKDAYIAHNIKNHKYVFIDVSIKSSDIIITIKDSAGGFNDKTIDKIFEPYFTTKHRSTGIGISLYMTNQVITKHYNGTIKASNQEFEYNGEKLKGAEFIINIPITI